MKVFYHNDMDGHAAGAIVAAVMRIRTEDDMHEVSYTDPIPVDIISDNELVFFVDYSFTKATKNILDKLIAKHCTIVWIDHHISSKNLIENYPVHTDKIITKIEMGYCGALLTWKFFSESVGKILIKNNNGNDLETTFLYTKKNDKNLIDIPHALKLIDDYDCWKHNLINSDEFKLGMDCANTNPMNFSFWRDLLGNQRALMYDMNESLEHIIINRGRIVKSYLDKFNESYSNNYGFEAILDGCKVYACNLKTNSWVFGDRIRRYDACVGFVFDGQKYQYSIYSENPEISCAEIAEKFGGGGHPGAAGFTTDEFVLKRI